MLFAHYQPAQRERLQALVQTPEWRELLAEPAPLARWKSEVTVPPAAPAQLSGAARYLRERNADRVQGLIRAGVRDEGALVEALGSWETALAGADAFPIFFLGLVLTLGCSFDPRRCIYCNQALLPRRLGLERWKALLDEVAEPTPPYVYVTGGEPLLLGEQVWGDDGLVAFAAKRGCAVNINTNATLITPRAALQMVKVGLARLHISVDSADPGVQAELYQGADRVEALWRGIFNVQIAREVLGANHPQIHINTVLTNCNLFQFPELLRFLLDVRKLPRADGGRKITADPAFSEFQFHLIPVGGKENEPLRPTAAEWNRFYTETWAEADRVWADYQAAVGVPEPERRSLVGFVPFANPFQRVNHRMSLDEYCEQAAQGVYWQGALTERCYVAPSQAYVLPDGSQHWCGAHAIRRPTPLGNVRGATVRENIRSGVGRLAELPSAFCTNCAGATCVINQRIEATLRNQVAAWLKEAAAT